MDYKRKIHSAILGVFAILTLPGFGVVDSINPLLKNPSPAETKSGVPHIVDYAPDSIAHYLLGRDYAASGRYELAREQYLLALAAADNREMQQSLMQELDSVNMMIKSLR
jgi:hypothetical protein